VELCAVLGWGPWDRSAIAAVTRRVGPGVQVDAAALELDLVDLAFAILFAAGFEGEQFRVARKPLQGGQQVLDRHALSVAARAR
jgi:hypothetical protein